MDKVDRRTISVLSRYRYEIPDPFAEMPHIPAGAKNLRVYVQVPGGGDWSHTDLEIGPNTPLIVEFTLLGIEEGE